MSLHGDIQVASLPRHIPALQTIISVEPGRRKISKRVLDPNGEEIWASPDEWVEIHDSGRGDGALPFVIGPVLIEDYGNYAVVVLIDEEVRRMPFCRIIPSQ